PHSTSLISSSNTILLSSPTFFPLFSFFNDTPPTEIYTLSLHDALPISRIGQKDGNGALTIPEYEFAKEHATSFESIAGYRGGGRSEEHTSELQSLTNLVCRLLLEKKKTQKLRRHQADQQHVARETLHAT